MRLGSPIFNSRFIGRDLIGDVNKSSSLKIFHCEKYTKIYLKYTFPFFDRVSIMILFALLFRVITRSLSWHTFSALS